MGSVEAALLSSALSGMLKIVTNKLAPLLIKEYSSIVGVANDLHELYGLVEEINNWLETVGDTAVRNDLSFNWLKQLKVIAYNVDDVVDEFQMETERYDADVEDSKHIVPKCLRMKTKSLLLQCKAAHKIKAIKKKFAKIVKQRTDFSAIVNSLPAGHHPFHHTNKTVEEIPSVPIIDEASVTGRDQEKRGIISKLVEPNEQQKVKIFSVIGLGGSGKTTLANLVFNDGNIIKKHFEVRLWIHVSQEFNVQNLLEKLFETFANNKSEHHPLQYMISRISDKLTKKRFLIVLDDVWTKDRIHWEQFMVHMKSGAPGSTILLTTRSREVAEAVESTEIFDLTFLSEADSWEVFIHSFGMAVNSLESEFLDVGKEIVNKCGGVPLAIKVLAGVLRAKKRIEDWQAMSDCNLLEVEDKEHRVSACLRLSYLNMPCHLKQCFTMCSLFPKGYVIDKEQLIDQWIAHCVITPADGGDCFDSLVHMCFLQNVHETFNGRVGCRMHDLVHDLARSILGDEISLVPKEKTHFTKFYRYFSLTKQSTKLPPKNVYGKARIIYAANGNYFTCDKALKNAKHLRSITVESISTTRAASIIVQIKNLRYLHISRLTCKALPNAISDIWSLESLHLPYSHLLELPQSIGKLQKLRTLNLSCCTRLKALPDSIGDCHMISSLDLSSCIGLTSLPNSISGNKNLRVLRLRETRIVRLMSSITTLGNLECLDLCHSNSLVELPEGIENLRKLKVLNLEGCLKLRSMPKGIHELVQLQKLGLFVLGKGRKCAELSELANIGNIGGGLTVTGIEHVTEPGDAHMACLKQKTNLQWLSLVWGRRCRVNVEKEFEVFNCLEPPSEIKGLEIKGYPGKKCTEWMQKQVGVRVHGPSQFACLTSMILSNFPKLKHLDGLVELPCLEVLRLVNMPALESISGGPFPSLVYFAMIELPKLKEVWMISERTLTCMEERGSCSNHISNLRQVQIGSCMLKLSIARCPALEVKLHLPLTLEVLCLNQTNGQLLRLPGQGQGSLIGACLIPSSLIFSHLASLTLWHVAATASPVLEKTTTSSPILEKKQSPPSSSRSRSQYCWELLQHMPALKYLEIRYCDGLIELPESIISLTSLQTLFLGGISALRMLPEWLGGLRSLNHLSIECCDNLSSLPTSMQQLTSLRRLEISNCTSLKLPEWLGNLRSLQYLWAHACWGSLKSLGPLTSLEELKIVGCDQKPQSPDRLEVCPCDAPQQLPEYLAEFRSLRVLCIHELRGLTSLPQSMGCLISLESLTLWQLHALQQLPESLGGLHSLRKLSLQGLHRLTSLPQSMCYLTSLEDIRLRDCPGIKSLPEGIRGLTALRYLWICDCPDLGRRCKGEDWHLISHVRDIYIDWQSRYRR
jgi:Leucine-rich repeat (LRR) protein